MRLQRLAMLAILLGWFTFRFYKGATFKDTWLTYNAPTHMFSFKYPPDWKLSIDGDGVTVARPDDFGAVMVFAETRSMPDNAHVVWAQNIAKDPSLNSIPKPASRRGWTGTMLEFTAGPESRSWITVMAKAPSHHVFFCANDSIMNERGHRGTYYDMLES